MVMLTTHDDYSGQLSHIGSIMVHGRNEDHTALYLAEESFVCIYANTFVISKLAAGFKDINLSLFGMIKVSANIIVFLSPIIAFFIYGTLIFHGVAIGTKKYI